MGGKSGTVAAIACAGLLWACGDAGVHIGGNGGVDRTSDAGRASCADRVRNGDETGIDCGGSGCASCGSGCPGTLTGGLFCDGMESFPAPWSYVNGVAPDSETVHSGSGSARVSLSSSTGSDLGLTRIPQPPTSGTVALRAYFLIATGGTFSRIVLMSAGSTERPPGQAYARIGVSIRSTGFSVYNGVTDETYVSSPRTVPRDQWLCVQLEVAVASDTGSLRLSVNGTGVLSRTGIDTAAFDGYDFINVGGSVAEGVMGNVTIYVDSVALGTAPIPC